MGVKERKEREKEEKRNLILNTASEIISTEGIDKLSIRKITEKIEYSPAIIYHYFKDKDDIVNQLMQRGYQKILSGLSDVSIPDAQPEVRLRETTRRYIEVALQMPDEFMAVQLSSSPAILEYTSSLFKGASIKKPALAMLHKNLKELYKDKAVDDSILELTAQVVAVASLGLIIKLILEKDIGEEQRAHLIDHFLDCIVDRMLLGKQV